MKTSPPVLLPLLRSATQGRLLEALLSDPEREWAIGELGAHVGTSPATVMREIDRAEQAGVVTSRRQGNTRLVRAAADSPHFDPLRRLLTPTFGVPRVLAEEFADVDGLEELRIVGSWAAAWHEQPTGRVRDVDVLAVGEAVDRGELYDAADRAEQRLGLPVDVVVREAEQWHASDTEASADPWLAQVRRQPTVTVFERPSSRGRP